MQEDRQQESNYLPRDEKPKYDNYLVIFVDILGSKNRESFEEQYRVNSIFHDAFDEYKDTLDYVVYQRKVYSFSDCAYVFYNYKEGIGESRKDDGKLFTVALCNCASLFLKLISERIIFRGGVAYGEAYVDSERAMFFGPAVNSAYLLESKEAIHPRVLIQDELATKVLENIDDVKYHVMAQDANNVMTAGRHIMPIMPLTGDGIIEKDIDGKYIYNLLYFPENGISLSGLYLEEEAFINDFMEFCYRQKDNLKDIKVIDKYNYLITFCEQKLLSFRRC